MSWNWTLWESPLCHGTLEMVTGEFYGWWGDPITRYVFEKKISYLKHRALLYMLIQVRSLSLWQPWPWSDIWGHSSRSGQSWYGCHLPPSLLDDHCCRLLCSYWLPHSCVLFLLAIIEINVSVLDVRLKLNWSVIYHWRHQPHYI